MSSAISTDRKRRQLRVIVAASLAGSLVPFFGVLLWFYNWRPTAGTVILAIGWGALLVAGFLLVRAATSIDLTRGPAVGDMTDDRRLELEREKRLLLKAIKEIEFDRGMGKIDDAEAHAAITRYRARAVEILRLLDDDEASGGSKNARIEAMIAREVAKRVGAPRAPEPAPAPVEAPAPVVAPPSAPTMRACACGQMNDPDAAFCKKCGQRLA